MALDRATRTLALMASSDCAEAQGTRRHKQKLEIMVLSRKVSPANDFFELFVIVCGLQLLAKREVHWIRHSVP